MRLSAFCVFLFCTYFLSAQNKPAYPDASRLDISDTLWGRTIHDPYRWLENLESSETKAWLEAQDKLRHNFSGRSYKALLHYLRVYSWIDHNPVRKIGRYYFQSRIVDEYEASSVFYLTSYEGDFRLLLNPSKEWPGRGFSVDGLTLSRDDRFAAIALSENAGDWKTIRFMEIENQRLLPDSLIHVKYSPLYWWNDGVFYATYDVEDQAASFQGQIGGRRLYYHKLGSPQSEDVFVYSSDNDYDYFSFRLSDEGGFLIVSHRGRTEAQGFTHISVMPLAGDSLSAFRDFIISRGSGTYFRVLGEYNGKLLVRSNLNAPTGMIYLYDPAMVNQAEVFLPPRRDQLEFAQKIGDKIILVYLSGNQSYAMINDLQGNNLTAWRIPEGYRFSGFSGSTSDSIAIYTFRSFFSPPSYYKLNLNTLKREMLSETRTLFPTSDLITERVYYFSKDSTLIPMDLTYKKGMRQNGKNPVLLYGYGGFGISMEPFFSVANIIFIRNGGILATPGIRGGGEYPGWHEQGMRLNKQNTIDDFIAAANFLTKQDYTNPSRLAAMGGSHGGFVVAAAMMQRPDLFGVVVSSAGVLDLLRYHLFNIGYVYRQEFGNVSDSLDFENLLRLSPLHNIRESVDYPATLFVAGGNDDRVLPFHSFKTLAALQSKTAGNKPHILYYDEKAGHSGSHIPRQSLEESAFVYSLIQHTHKAYFAMIIARPVFVEFAKTAILKISNWQALGIRAYF
jgi:prolyl oligopeptidase